MRFSLATAAVTVSLCTGLGLGFFNTASAESNQSFDRTERGRYLSVPAIRRRARAANAVWNYRGAQYHAGPRYRNWQLDG